MSNVNSEVEVVLNLEKEEDEDPPGRNREVEKMREYILHLLFSLESRQLNAAPIRVIQEIRKEIVNYKSEVIYLPPPSLTGKIKRTLIRCKSS